MSVTGPPRHRHARLAAGDGPGQGGPGARSRPRSAAPVDALTLMPFTTTGDAIQDRAARRGGGKGLFTKELDAALARRPHRPRRAFGQGPADRSCRTASSSRATCRARMRATCSSRRSAASLARRCRRARWSARPRPAAAPSCCAPGRTATVTLLRGNVGTRLAKLERGEVGATLLALAGPEAPRPRAHTRPRILSPDEMLPAVGQGAIAITARTEDARGPRRRWPRSAIARPSAALAAERAFLAVLDGSCRTPIAGSCPARRTDAVASAASCCGRTGAMPREVALEGPRRGAERSAARPGSTSRPAAARHAGGLTAATRCASWSPGRAPRRPQRTAAPPRRARATSRRWRPSSTIVPTGAPLPAGPFDALILTSANAVRPGRRRRRLGASRSSRSGAETAGRRAAAGFAHVTAGGRRRAALAALRRREPPAPGRAAACRRPGPEGRARATRSARAGYAVATWDSLRGRCRRRTARTAARPRSCDGHDRCGPPLSRGAAPPSSAARRGGGARRRDRARSPCSASRPMSRPASRRSGRIAVAAVAGRGRAARRCSDR